MKIENGVAVLTPEEQQFIDLKELVEAHERVTPLQAIMFTATVYPPPLPLLVWWLPGPVIGLVDGIAESLGKGE